jgi:SAM-dependent methyltransferase
MNTETEYWNSYYRTSGGRLSAPSQFAAFILGETSQRSLIIDIGCGSGRDSFFFSNFGHSVIGVDSSSTAISQCNSMSDHRSTLFYNASVVDLALEDIIKSSVGYIESPAVVVYSRFFLHAINDTDADRFLELSHRLLKGKSGILALEFRTHLDESRPKETSPHYRRFINPINLMNKLIHFRFRVEYFASGFGFAKYREDDAHVARFIAVI